MKKYRRQFSGTVYHWSRGLQELKHLFANLHGVQHTLQLISGTEVAFEEVAFQDKQVIWKRRTIIMGFNDEFVST